MCEFVSFIEKKGKVNQILFLTKPLIESEKGKKLLAGVPHDDLVGHGAIRLFFGFGQDEGTNRECTDFSKPSNFPSIIVRAIKRGDMRGMGTPQGLLSDAVDAKWKAEWDAVDAKWRPERDAVDAKGKAEWKAADAKFWDLFTNPENRNPEWR